MKPDEVAALGGILSFVLALVIFFLDQEDKKRRPRAVVWSIVLLLIGIALALWIRAARAPANPPPGRSVPVDKVPPSGRATDSVNDPRDTPTIPPPDPNDTLFPYHGWLRRDGALIRYNAVLYMPGSCPGRIMAVGDFGSGGWTSGPLAECEADGWLTFDAGQLLLEPRFVSGHTYCLNFLDDQGRYGQHGAPPRAPGLSAIGVPAREGAQAGITMGFRVVRSADGPLVEFTNEGIPHCE